MCAFVSNGDFQQYWRYHLAHEHERVHRSRYAAEQSLNHAIAA